MRTHFAYLVILLTPLSGAEVHAIVLASSPAPVGPYSPGISAGVRPKNMRPSATASPCVFAGDTLYCSAKDAFIPGPNAGIYAGTIETQVRQSVRNLLDNLEEADMDLGDVVAANVYLDVSV